MVDKIDAVLGPYQPIMDAAADVAEKHRSDSRDELAAAEPAKAARFAGADGDRGCLAVLRMQLELTDEV